jgi:putative tryptophan/tyrosine transport system substrate-binding protein
MLVRQLTRRGFFPALTAAVGWPFVGRAQQSAMPVIGVLGGASPTRNGFAFDQGLKEAGYVNGQNVRIEYRWANGVYQLLPALASELVNQPVAVIIAFGTAAAQVAKTASVNGGSAIPVVFSMASDPVADGLVASLNRPGGNITGVTSVGGELPAKRLELVREFISADTAIAILINPANSLAAVEKQQIEAASHAIGQRLEVLNARNEFEIDNAFTRLEERHIGALIIAADNFYYGEVRRIAALASRHKVPTIGPLRDFAVEGGLMSYGTSIFEVVRQAAVYVGKILDGAKPADLPVLQPTKFDLVINLRTAKTLGIEFSPKLLAIADEVIE